MKKVPSLALQSGKALKSLKDRASGGRTVVINLSHYPIVKGSSPADTGMEKIVKQKIEYFNK